MRCPKEGTRVRFRPNPASLMMYSRNYGLPKSGEGGRVTSVPLPGGRRTCLPGPGGGLIYVDWDGGGFVGVSKHDIVSERTSKPFKGASKKRRR